MSMFNNIDLKFTALNFNKLYNDDVYNNRCNYLRFYLSAVFISRFKLLN